MVDDALTSAASALEGLVRVADCLWKVLWLFPLFPAPPRAPPRAPHLIFYITHPPPPPFFFFPPPPPPPLPPPSCLLNVYVHSP
eukprot:SAG11_NODE_11181_length_778_cov_1.082474_1_plen_83_part_10